MNGPLLAAHPGGDTRWLFDIEVEVAPPSEGVFFSIDLPIAGMTLYGDQLEIAGWAFGFKDSVTAIEVEVGGHATTRLTPQPRDDVAAAYPQFPHAGHSGFALLTRVPRAARMEVGVSIVLANERLEAATIRLAGRAHETWSSVNAPLVSVVIPCHNQGRFLREAVESVRHQTYPQVEPIVVDDGSTDDTSMVAASCGVRCVRQENRGVSAARNRGAAAATGEFVVFLDADDRLLPHGLEANVDAFAARPELALVAGWFRQLTSTGEPVPGWGPPLTPPEQDHYAAFLQSSYYIACPAQAMFRRAILLAANGFDESYKAAEDYELYLRMARKHPMLLHSVPVAEYRRHPGGVSTDSALVLESELAVLRAQRTWVRRDPSLRAAYKRGVALCVDFYGRKVALDLRSALREHEWRTAGIAAWVLARRYPSGLVHMIGDPVRWFNSARRLRRHLRALRLVLRQARDRIVETVHHPDRRTSDADNPLRVLDARARAQVSVLARVEAQLGVRASPRRSEETVPTEEVLAGTSVTPRAADSHAGPPLLTVVMATYGKERFVADAIESVLAQRTGFPIELIVTDDPSADSTSAIIEAFRVRRPELITVIRPEKNEWLFAVILRSLALANTEYFTVLDADDYWIDETYLQRGVDFLEGHPEFSIYSANCFREQPDGSRSLYFPAEAPDDEFGFEDFLQNRALPTHTTATIFRNVLFGSGVPRVFADMLGTDEQYVFLCGDYDRYLLHLEKGKARFENHAVGVYRMTGDGMWTRLNEFEKNLWEAQTRLSFWRYFGYRHPEFFLRDALNWSDRCLEIMRNAASGPSTETVIKPEQVAHLRRVVEECHSHLAALI